MNIGRPVCVFELRNESRRETFLTIAGLADPESEVPLDSFPAWTADDQIRREVLDAGLDWDSAEHVLVSAVKARKAARWRVRAPAFALELAS